MWRRLFRRLESGRGCRCDDQGGVIYVAKHCWSKRLWCLWFKEPVMETYGTYGDAPALD